MYNSSVIGGLNAYSFCGNNPQACPVNSNTIFSHLSLSPHTDTEESSGIPSWLSWLISGLTTVAGIALCFVPGMQVAGAGLIVAGAIGLVAQGLSAAGADSVTISKITSALNIAVGIIMMVTPLAPLGAGMIGAGIGSIAGGYISLAVGGSYEVGAMIGGIVGGMVGGFAYSKITKWANRPCCFIAGTLVLCKDKDDNEVYKNIEDVEVGDFVWSYDEKTGKNDWKEVVQLFRNETSAWICTEVEVDGKTETIKSTAEHPYFILNADSNAPTVVYEGSTGQSKGKWIAAKDLKVGYKCLLSNGKTGIISKQEVEHLAEPETTYNFEVEGFHTYYVGENGILVHNDCISDELTKIANKYGNEQCVEATKEMKAFLQSKGIKANQIEIRFSGGKHNFVVSDTFGSTAISTNGYHTGVLYKGMVFDNIHKAGLAYSSWVDDFFGLGTRTITRIPF